MDLQVELYHRVQSQGARLKMTRPPPYSVALLLVDLCAQVAESNEANWIQFEIFKAANFSPSLSSKQNSRPDGHRHP